MEVVEREKEKGIYTFHIWEGRGTYGNGNRPEIRKEGNRSAKPSSGKQLHKKPFGAFKTQKSPKKRQIWNANNVLEADKWKCG